ncbi:MAG: ABC transporter ATP-binding protein [Candidatus Methylacidiphilales bacterium]
MAAITRSAGTSPAVNAEGLTKTFKLNWRRGKLLALDQLDLRVQPGEVYGLLGPNGSGKSTTMKLLLGLIKPTSGRIEIFGHPAGTMEARSRVGFLPENPYFPSFLTGAEALTYYGGLCNLSGRALQDRAKELLALVGLERSAGRPLRTYSKGMLQRIGLAQALLHDPDLLFLDEPTAGVDPVGSRQIRDLILSLRQRGKTIVFSSHLLEQVQEVADRVGILYRGQKLREGPLNDLLTVPDAIEVTLPGAKPGDEEKVRNALAAAGMTGAEVHRPRMSLEDYFISVLPSQEGP